MSSFEALKSRIAEKTVSAAIIGLGYVGLPLAQSMLNAGLRVYGLDVDETKIESLKRGDSYIDAVESAAIKKAQEKELFHPSSDFSLIRDADFIVICVPTPLDDHFAPDLSYVETTAQTISQFLRSGHVVVLESTTYPGTMNEVVKPILEKSGLQCDEDFYIAYSPERENPGSQTHSTSTIPKVVGANTKTCLELSQLFYSLFIKDVVPVSSVEVAEASKIMENIFRSVNIALVNELKIIFDKMGLDVWEVIETAKTKPFGFMPFYPGPGLGGHCIPIDPFYLSWKAKELGVPTRFIELAGEINTAMPDFVLRKLTDALNDLGKKAVSGSKILILGISYKKNVADQRETPAFPIINSLLERGAEVDFYDPHIPKILPNRNFPKLAGKETIDWSVEALKSYDACVIVSDHDAIAYEDLVEANTIIVDTRNVHDIQNSDCHYVVKA